MSSSQFSGNEGFVNATRNTNVNRTLNEKMLKIRRNKRQTNKNRTRLVNIHVIEKG